jgi:cytochrome c peroxidase
VSCHSGPSLTDHAFHNVGLAPAVVAVTFVDSDDRGAAEGLVAAKDDPLSSHGPHSDGDREVLPATVGDDMEGAFRTPTLRCMNQQPSFMHTGQIRSMASVVAFFNRGGDTAGQYPGVSELAPLGLSERDQADLVAFLATLQGEGPPAALLEAPR